MVLNSMKSERQSLETRMRPVARIEPHRRHLYQSQPHRPLEQLSGRTLFILLSSQ